MDVTFAQSAFPPLALGFFGLGTGYLIYGPKELFGYPKARDGDEAAVARGLGVWGIWMPGFCQFVTGIILFVGLTWLQVFSKSAPLYMAALAFSAYGIHWFAIGWNRYRGNNPQVNAGMCVAFMVISAMGANVFFAVGDWPVGVLFLGQSPTLKNTVAPIAEITMNATHMPAFVRGSLPRYRFQPIANQWMPYAENASAAM